MNDLIFSNIKIWSIVGAVELTGKLAEYDLMTSIFVQTCGGLASLAIAWSHIQKGRKK